MEFITKLSFIYGIGRTLINAANAWQNGDKQHYQACIDQALADLIYLVRDDRPQEEKHDSPIPAPTAQ